MVCVCLFKSISMGVLNRFVETRDIKFISVNLYTAIALRQENRLLSANNIVLVGRLEELN